MLPHFAFLRLFHVDSRMLYVKLAKHNNCGLRFGGAHTPLLFVVPPGSASVCDWQAETTTVKQSIAEKCISSNDLILAYSSTDMVVESMLVATLTLLTHKKTSCIAWRINGECPRAWTICRPTVKMCQSACCRYDLSVCFRPNRLIRNEHCAMQNTVTQFLCRFNIGQSGSVDYWASVDTWSTKSAKS